MTATVESCEIERIITEMSIEVFEWPLPEDETACVSAVFELSCPSPFAAWRRVTWIILNDLGRPPVSSPDKPAVILFDYSGLKIYAMRSNARLSFASKKKQFAKAHYIELTFPVSIEKCLVPNALEYQLYDLEKAIWVDSQAAIIPSTERWSHTDLPNGLYLHL